MGPIQDPSDENDPGAAPSANAEAMPRESSAKFSIPLTLTEQRVLDLVSQCRTNREIAKNLGISPATVKRHIENILRKLNLRNRVEAAIYTLSVQCCTNGNGLVCPLESWWRKSRDDHGNGPNGP